MRRKCARSLARVEAESAVQEFYLSCEALLVSRSLSSGWEEGSSEGESLDGFAPSLPPPHLLPTRITEVSKTETHHT